MNYIVTSTITTTAFRVSLELEGEEISLSYNGDNKYTSKDKLSITDGILNVEASVRGIDTTSWKTEIEVKREGDDDYNKKLSKNRTIKSNRKDSFTSSIKL